MSVDFISLDEAATPDVKADVDARLDMDLTEKLERADDAEPVMLTAPALGPFAVIVALEKKLAFLKFMDELADMNLFLNSSSEDVTDWYASAFHDTLVCLCISCASFVRVPSVSFSIISLVLIPDASPTRPFLALSDDIVENIDGDIYAMV